MIKKLKKKILWNIKFFNYIFRNIVYKNILYTKYIIKRNYNNLPSHIFKSLSKKLQSSSTFFENILKGLLSSNAFVIIFESHPNNQIYIFFWTVSKRKHSLFTNVKKNFY